MHAPTSKRRPLSATLKKDNSEDNVSVVSATAKAMHEAEQAAIAKAVTFLNHDTVRWMNKRRTHKGSSMAAHVLPSRAVQLREIFKNLDFDNSGSIDIVEMKQAVQFVSAQDKTSSDPLFKDPKKLTDFFSSMDINNDGTVDFNEFLIAMTSDASTDESRNKTLRLQNAFYEFAMKHKRQKILDILKYQSSGGSLDGSISNLNAIVPSASDLQRYEELKNLFSLQYFRIENVDTSLNDELNRVKEEAKKQQKEIFTNDYKRKKKLEISRAREASMQIRANKRNYILQQLQSTVAKPPILPETNVALLNQTENGFETRMRKTEKNLRKTFADFPLNAVSTHVPTMESIPTASTVAQIRKAAQEQIVSIQTEKFKKSSIPPILPPISMKKQLGLE